MTNFKLNNTHARTPSLSIYDFGEDMQDNYRTRERIRNREIADLFAPKFRAEESKLSLGYVESLKDNYETSRKNKEKNLVDLFAPEFEDRK